MDPFPIYHVDAFTDHIFGGNPAAVCLLHKWLSETDLHAIAKENNLPVTAFLKRDGNLFHIRWITPDYELDICGHGTIATGYVIRGEGDYPFDHTSFIATLLKWKNIDPSEWNMGNRVACAPTFEGVITETVPRKDPILSRGVAEILIYKESLNMGDPIVLKDHIGNCLKVSLLDSFATVGSKSVPIQFSPSGGKITHGSFVLVQCDQYVLDSNSVIGDCYFNANTHTPNQWWTVKSVDHPHLGYEIKNGDRIYLESHVYIDPLTYVPGRLTTSLSLLLGTSVTTKPINEENADACYWTIEKY